MRFVDVKLLTTNKYYRYLVRCDSANRLYRPINNLPKSRFDQVCVYC